MYAFVRCREIWRAHTITVESHNIDNSISSGSNSDRVIGESATAAATVVLVVVQLVLVEAAVA